MPFWSARCWASLSFCLTYAFIIKQSLKRKKKQILAAFIHTTKMGNFLCRDHVRLSAPYEGINKICRIFMCLIFGPSPSFPFLFICSMVKSRQLFICSLIICLAFMLFNCHFHFCWRCKKSVKMVLSVRWKFRRSFPFFMENGRSLRIGLILEMIFFSRIINERTDRPPMDGRKGWTVCLLGIGPITRIPTNRHFVYICVLICTNDADFNNDPQNTS